MNKFLLILIPVVFVAAACNQKTAGYDAVVEIGNEKLFVTVADEAAEQQKGLSAREKLGDRQGMLFVYSEPQRPVFWMKDMKFPIDIIWIRHNQIADLTLSAQPQPGLADYQLPLYRPKRDVDTVLEVNAGWVIQNNITVGDEVRITFY